jgi:hypothetical protein
MWNVVTKALAGKRFQSVHDLRSAVSRYNEHVASSPSSFKGLEYYVHSVVDDSERAHFFDVR